MGRPLGEPAQDFRGGPLLSLEGWPDGPGCRRCRSPPPPVRLPDGLPGCRPPRENVPPVPVACENHDGYGCSKQPNMARSRRKEGEPKSAPDKLAGFDDALWRLNRVIQFRDRDRICCAGLTVS